MGDEQRWFLWGRLGFKPGGLGRDLIDAMGGDMLVESRDINHVDTRQGRGMSLYSMDVIVCNKSVPTRVDGRDLG